MENEVVAKRAQKAWPKVTWQSLQESKQPGQGKPENDKSLQLLLSYNNYDLVPLKFAFFEEISYKLSNFLRRFQTDAPMLPFLADTIEEILRELCKRIVQEH